MAEKQLFINGRIFTSDDENLWADAMIVCRGRILWAGRKEQLPDWDGPPVDLKGRCVIPGFVDAHMHPVMLADFRKKITIMPPATVSYTHLTLPTNSLV